MSTDYVKIEVRFKIDMTDPEAGNAVRETLSARMSRLVEELPPAAIFLRAEYGADREGAFDDLRQRFTWKCQKGIREGRKLARVDLNTEDTNTTLLAPHTCVGDEGARNHYSKGLPKVFYGLPATHYAQHSRVVFEDGTIYPF